MKVIPPLTALFLLLAPAVPAADWTPPDIAAYVLRSVQCNQGGGEKTYDKARVAEINRAVAKLNGRALDANEKALRRRYRHAPEQLKQIRAVRDALL